MDVVFKQLIFLWRVLLALVVCALVSSVSLAWAQNEKPIASTYQYDETASTSTIHEAPADRAGVVAVEQLHEHGADVRRVAIARTAIEEGSRGNLLTGCVEARGPPGARGGVTPPSHQLPATAMHGSRLDVIADVNSVLSKHLESIRAIAPDARVGFRGSLAKGFKGPHKKNAPFDANSFDVDAFIVSDQLPRRMFGNFGQAPPEVQRIAAAIDADLRAVPGLRGLRGGKDSFDFRVFREREIAKKIRQGDVQIYVGK